MSEFTMDEYRNMDKYLSKFTRCGLAKFTPLIVTCAVTGGKFFPSVWNMIDWRVPNMGQNSRKNEESD